MTLTLIDVAAIHDAMPDSLAKYEADMKSYLARVESLKLQQQQQPTGAADNQIINIDLTTSSQEGVETTKAAKPANKISAPKRNFKWTTAAKSLLINLVAEELESLKNAKAKTSGGGTVEEQLTRFFNGSVIEFWPAKWMTTL